MSQWTTHIIDGIDAATYIYFNLKLFLAVIAFLYEMSSVFWVKLNQGHSSSEQSMITRLCGPAPLMGHHGTLHLLYKCTENNTEIITSVPLSASLRTTQHSKEAKWTPWNHMTDLKTLENLKHHRLHPMGNSLEGKGQLEKKTADLELGLKGTVGTGCP